ncbi:anti-sigma factor family protein [Streptomyces sp. NPDC058646]|uniref:anti-sigma factor family protein n=1 Tax=Streptomyces sp. NPDC058646 TaxID=3346574 RepID=UPI00364A741C
MTPPNGVPGTAGTIRHPDVSEISDLTEGLLSPSRAAEVRRHLGDCALCADVRASLEEIRGLLGTLPGPSRMPADVAGRIDAALAAEALLDATTPRVSPQQGRPPAPESLPGATDPAVSRETSPGAPTRPGARGPAGHPSGRSGPGRRRARRRIAVLAGLTGAAACALGIFLFGDFAGQPAHQSAARNETSAAQPHAADGSYTPQGLQNSVRQLLAAGQGSKTVPGEQNNTYGVENTPPGTDLAPGDRGASTVPACVLDGTGRAEAPIATGRGTYEGRSVLLLVLPHPGDPARVDAYLVDSSCEGGAPATPGRLLLKSTYPRS